MFGDDLGRRMFGNQQFRRTRVKSDSLIGFEQAVYGHPDEPVRERDRIGGVEKLPEDEFFGGDHTAVGLQAG